MGEIEKHLWKEVIGEQNISQTAAVQPDDDGASVQEHLNYFNFLISKLMALDIKIDDDEKDSLLLCSISDSWNSLIMNLSYTKSLKLESIIALLFTEELRYKLSQSSLIDVMVARGMSIEGDHYNRRKSISKSKTKKRIKYYSYDK